MSPDVTLLLSPSPSVPLSLSGCLSVKRLRLPRRVLQANKSAHTFKHTSLSVILRCALNNTCINKPSITTTIQPTHITQQQQHVTRNTTPNVDWCLHINEPYIYELIQTCVCTHMHTSYAYIYIYTYIYTHIVYTYLVYLTYSKGPLPQTASPGVDSVSQGRSSGSGCMM